MGKSIVTAPEGANWFEISRDFAAPRALVWKMYTEPQHLVHFWGPKGGSVPRCEVDLRVGGMWHHTMRFPGGNDYSYSSRFLELVPPEKIVYRDAPLNAAAEDDLAPATMVSTIRLEEIPVGTRVVAHIEVLTTEARDETIRNGFALMVDGGHDQMEEYLKQFL
jgi:uncharacterized protein YndB with AHSA1/START domain